MKVVIDDKIPYIKGVPEALGFETVYLKGADISAADVRDVDALITRTRTHAGAALLEGSRVRYVITATIGYDHLDTAWLDAHGIRWTNCPGCNAASVGQYFLTSMIVLRQQGVIDDFSRTTVGIVGVGHVGSVVRDEALRLGCKVLLSDPPLEEKNDTAGFSTLDEIAKNADVITFHVPLTHNRPYATYHMGDSRFFASLRRRPVVMNASRGAVVDNEAWLQSLEEGTTRAAVIDTWESEPHIMLPLLEKAIIATPHIAGYSADGKANATRMALTALCRYAGVEPRFSIVPPKLPASMTRPDDPIERELALYNPLRDTAALKADPSRFEALRGNYPLRREVWDQA